VKKKQRVGRARKGKDGEVKTGGEKKRLNQKTNIEHACKWYRDQQEMISIPRAKSHEGNIAGLNTIPRT
jgi:hypothetical protein